MKRIKLLLLIFVVFVNMGNAQGNLSFTAYKNANIDVKTNYFETINEWEQDDQVIFLEDSIIIIDKNQKQLQTILPNNNYKPQTFIIRLVTLKNDGKILFIVKNLNNKTFPVNHILISQNTMTIFYYQNDKLLGAFKRDFKDDLLTPIAKYYQSKLVFPDN